MYVNLMNSGKVTIAEMACLGRFHGNRSGWRVTKTWLHFQMNDTCLNLEESLSALISYDLLHVSRKLFRCFRGNTSVARQYSRNVTLKIFVLELYLRVVSGK